MKRKRERCNTKNHLIEINDVTDFLKDMSPSIQQWTK